MPNDRPLVVTVHGINSDGDWQDQVEEVLAPHCHCAAFRYPEYRYGGFTTQFFSPGRGLLTIACAGLLMALAFVDPTVGPALPAWLEAIRPETRDPRAWAFEYSSVPILFAPLFLGLATCWGPREPWRFPVARTRFIVVAVLGAIWVGSAFASPAALRSAWIWLVPLGAVVLVLFSLLEHCRRFEMVNDVKAVTLPLGAVLLAGWIGGFLGASRTAPATWHWLAGAASALVICLTVAIFMARRRRENVVNRLRQFLDAQMRHHGVTVAHVIAHSFGTYLTGRILEGNRDTTPVIRLRRIILVGSVLTSEYKWEDMVGEGTDSRWEQVRNEAGGRDGVVRWAGYTQHVLLLLRIGFGNAGRHGFREREPLVHRVNNSLDFCEACRTRDERRMRRVHNLHLPTFQHSDAFATVERAERFWLPFLLGIEPWEYWEFRRLCVKAMTFDQRMARNEDERKQVNERIEAARIAVELADPSRAEAKHLADERLAEAALALTALDRRRKDLSVQLAELEALLGQQIWDWTFHELTSRENLAGYLTDRIAFLLFQATPAALTNPVDKAALVASAGRKAQLAVKETWRAVARGLVALEKLKESKLRADVSLTASDRAELALINPWVAVSSAIETALHS